MSARLRCGRPCPHEHPDRDWHPNGCEKPDGHPESHVCSHWMRHEWAKAATIAVTALVGVAGVVAVAVLDRRLA